MTERKYRNPKKTAFQLYYDTCERVTDELNDAQLGKVMRAIIAFELYGEETEFPDKLLTYIYKDFKESLLRSDEKYNSRCEKNRENAQKRWDKERESDHPLKDDP